jgi:hypothetical protein
LVFHSNGTAGFGTLELSFLENFLLKNFENISEATGTSSPGCVA